MSYLNIWRIIFLSPLIIFMNACVISCPTALAVIKNPKFSIMTIHTGKGDVELTVEVADTHALRERGLMFQRTLSPNSGMLFVFDEVDNHSFWMKNTVVALDVIFFDASFKIIGIVAENRPQDLRAIRINAPSKYVLEVLAGTVRERGIKVHDTASIDKLGR
jgi:uncharacterized membrane protein (UPF0127 family)